MTYSCGFYILPEQVSYEADSNLSSDEWTWKHVPIRFEKAMKAHMALEPWDESYERIRVGNAVTSADVFGS